MDEVDGCSSGDKGGIAALIKIIAITKMPIVCIANNHGSRKIHSLVNHCYDLKLQRPVQNENLHRMKYICAEENFKIEIQDVEKISSFGNNDIRQIMNTL